MCLLNIEQPMAAWPPPTPPLYGKGVARSIWSVCEYPSRQGITENTWGIVVSDLLRSGRRQMQHEDNFHDILLLIILSTGVSDESTTSPTSALHVVQNGP